MPVYPTQIYEAVYNVAIFALLVWAYRRKRGDGYLCLSGGTDYA